MFHIPFAVAYFKTMGFFPTYITKKIFYVCVFTGGHGS